MRETKKNTTMTATMEKSEYDIPQPTITITFPKGTDYRIKRAIALQLAAEVEMATLGDKWCVSVIHGCETKSFVYLELVLPENIKRTEAKSEEQRGMETLAAAIKNYQE